MRSRLFMTHSLVLAALLVSACATTQPTNDRHDRAIVDVASGELLSHAQAVRSLRRVRHIYVGEHHTSAPHHAVQLEVARSLHDAGVEIGIGIEWLSAEHQASLDAWVAGTLSESDFQTQVDWKSNWGHTFEAYVAILRFARDRGIPVWGLNASPGLARAVGRMGPERLNDDLRAKLPPLTTANEAHRAFFKSMMAAAHHGHSPHGKPGAHR
ncbi:MAG: putative iron-regulated protein, partial [Myxococcota bacterium]